MPRTKRAPLFRSAKSYRHPEASGPMRSEAGGQGRIAVKVIDDLGNELLVVKKLGEGK